MKKPPVKIFVALAAIALAVFAWSFTHRRISACSGEGKYMSTVGECERWGIAAETCANAVEAARKLVSQKGPKHEKLFDCELRYSDCIEGIDGGYVPKPSFCLRPDQVSPSEVRYLTFDSDRMNRRKTREVPID